jgi:hypothetical protein
MVLPEERLNLKKKKKKKKKNNNNNNNKKLFKGENKKILLSKNLLTLRDICKLRVTCPTMSWRANRDKTHIICQARILRLWICQK